MADIEGRERLQNLIGDDYRLQWIIGHGGMSTVWLADDTVHDREVALKILRPEFSDNREFLTRFRNEAETAELIDSDNVVRTYDYREIPDPAGHTFCFIAMEYVRGESLADLLAREKSLDEALVLDVLEQAAHGLSIIHRMDLVHRDIKPGNLMITQNGQVKITDFGIAKAAAAVPLTRTGMVVGTAQYVSPEQAQGKEVTSASDVYSLGVVGYEMLAGQRPFVGDSSVSVALAHISQSPPPLSTSVSAEARELIGIALRKDPTQRFADGNELARRLRRAPGQASPTAGLGGDDTGCAGARADRVDAHARPGHAPDDDPPGSDHRAPAASPGAAPGRAAAAGRRFRHRPAARGAHRGAARRRHVPGVAGRPLRGHRPRTGDERAADHAGDHRSGSPHRRADHSSPGDRHRWITPTPEPEPEPAEPETTPDPVQPEQPAPPDNGGGTPGELDQLLEDLGNLTNGGN